MGRKKHEDDNANGTGVESPEGIDQTNSAEGIDQNNLPDPNEGDGSSDPDNTDPNVGDPNESDPAASADAPKGPEEITPPVTPPADPPKAPEVIAPVAPKAPEVVEPAPRAPIILVKNISGYDQIFLKGEGTDDKRFVIQRFARIPLVAMPVWVRESLPYKDAFRDKNLQLDEI